MLTDSIFCTDRVPEMHLIPSCQTKMPTKPVWCHSIADNMAIRDYIRQHMNIYARKI